MNGRAKLRCDLLKVLNKLSKWSVSINFLHCLRALYHVIDNGYSRCVTAVPPPPGMNLRLSLYHATGAKTCVALKPYMLLKRWYWYRNEYLLNRLNSDGKGKNICDWIYLKKRNVTLQNNFFLLKWLYMLAKFQGKCYLR